MVDRSEIKPFKHWLNPYLQTLTNSLYGQSRLRLTTSANPLIQSTDERQEQAQRMTTHDIASRTAYLYQNHHRNYSRPLKNTAARSLTQNSKTVKQNYSTQSYNVIRIREQNSSDTLPRVEINDERSTRVTSVYQQDDRPYALFEERLACEITMSYAPTTTLTAEKSSREEITVMQRYSTGETMLVYRGYLAKGVGGASSTEISITVNPNLLELAKSSETTTIQSSSIDAKETSAIPATESTDTKQNLTDKSEDNPQNANKTEAIATMPDGFNLDQFVQILRANLKQNMCISIQQNDTSRMKRHSKSVENFCYILENHLSISKDEQHILRGLINLGFTFNDINSKESIEFLKKILNERIILILSKSSMENLSKNIQDEPLLCAIYVIDSSEKCSFDSKLYRGSFPNMNKFCEQLENDLQLFTYDLTSICSIPADYTGMSTLNYVQALKDIILEPDEKRDLKKEMIDFCCEEYANNIIQLKLIDEFEKNFQPDDAIHWYLRHEAFLHKMITRAFRVLDPDILFKLRYFIQHLHSKLKSSINTNSLTVYRTLRIRKDLFDKMKRNQGALLSFNEFLLVNKNKATIEPCPMNIDSKLVHFEIVLGTGLSICDVPTKPNEFILNVGIIFRIDKLESIDEETFAVKLTTNDEILKAGQLIAKDLREAVRASFPLVRMVKLMKQRELTSYTEYFCLMLIDDQQAIKDETTNLTLGGSLHSLGTYYYERKQYEQALNHLQKSLKVYLRVLPDDDVRLTPTYNNIGSIYNKQGLHEQALEYHRKAYEIQKKATDPDMDSVSAYAGNIASVLMKLKRYKEAISYLELDLQIKQKLHPNNDHPDLAAKYHNLAAAQYRLCQYSEALENYQKCLNIELKCHLSSNPTVSVTYYNMATTLEELGQFQEAKEAVEKAITRLLLTKQEDDEEIKMQRKYLQRLEQKIWMKSLFTTT
ncbi:unnamed protein product [Rotaria sp. Silwood2]|nr:unnamed protein product [Rotaria sp. Silwood2]